MPLLLFQSLSGQRKDEVQQVIPAGGQQEGHLATKTLHHKTRGQSIACYV